MGMISDEYLHQLQELRRLRPHWGCTGYRYAQDVYEFADNLDAESILDFGCGTCSLKDGLEGKFKYSGYDPAIPGMDTLPDEHFDVICCIDVLEHVEEQHIFDVLDYIYDHSRLGVWFLVSTTEAKTLLPDGRNAHITVKSPSEWGKVFGEYNWGEYSIDPLPGQLIFTARK
jgi:2-polyprenyl-3-methyl-5-hydroxy-6-metoxy-1,4-benzoquinol methylase